MTIKISQLPPISAVASNTLLKVIDPAGPTSLNATAAQLQTFILNGNAATVTNGVYTTDTGTVTNTMLAGSIANNKLSNSAITINGVSISLGGSGSITTELPVASNLILGGVIVGSGIDVALDGTISVDLSGLATESYVTSQGYITSSDLTGLATESYVTSQGYITSSDLTGLATESYVTTATSSLQATLVSGTNIKTINNESLLGGGNITIAAGTPTAITTTASSTNSNFKVSFLNTTSNSTGDYGLLQDSGTNFTYNPSSNTLNNVTLGSSVTYSDAPERSSSSTTRGDIYNEVNSFGATLVGYSTGASGWNNETALGYGVISGSRSIGIGYSVRAGGSDNIVIGFQSRAGQDPWSQSNGNLILGSNITVSSNAPGTIYLRAAGNTQFGPQETTVATQGFYVDPIQTGTASNILYYDTTTKQVTYGAAPTTGGGEFTVPQVNGYGSSFFGNVNSSPGSPGSPPTNSSSFTELVVYDSEFDDTVNQFGSRYLSLEELTSVGGNDSFFPAETYQLKFYYGSSNGSQLTINQWVVSGVVDIGRNNNFFPGGQALAVTFENGSYEQTINTNNPPPNGVSFFGFTVVEGTSGDGGTASARIDVDYFTTYVADISTIVQADGSQNKHHPVNFTLGYANIGAPGGNVTKGWSAFEGTDFTANGISFPLVSAVASDIGTQAAGSSIIQLFQGTFGSDAMYTNYARCIQLDTTKRYVISVSVVLLAGSSFSSSRYTSPSNVIFNSNDTYSIRTAGSGTSSTLSKVFPQGSSGGLSPVIESIITPVGTKYVLFDWRWQTDNGVNMSRDFNININVRRIS